MTMVFTKNNPRPSPVHIQIHVRTSSIHIQGFLRALQAQEQEQQQEGGDNGEGAGAIAAVSAQELSMLQVRLFVVGVLASCSCLLVIGPL